MNLIDYPTIRSVIPPRKYYYYDRHRYLNNATVRWINGEPVVTHQMNVDIHQFTPNPHESDIARNNNHSLAIQWQEFPPYAPLFNYSCHCRSWYRLSVPYGGGRQPMIK